MFRVTLGRFGGLVWKWYVTWKWLIEWSWQLGISNTSMKYMGCLKCQYFGTLLNFMSHVFNQSHFALQILKLGLLSPATWLLSIKLTWSYLASAQAEDQGPWAFCYWNYEAIAICCSKLLLAHVFFFCHRLLEWIRIINIHHGWNFATDVDFGTDYNCGTISDSPKLWIRCGSHLGDCCSLHSHMAAYRFDEHIKKEMAKTR